MVNLDIPYYKEVANETYNEMFILYAFFLSVLCRVKVCSGHLRQALFSFDGQKHCCWLHYR